MSETQAEHAIEAGKYYEVVPLDGSEDQKCIAGFRAACGMTLTHVDFFDGKGPQPVSVREIRPPQAGPSSRWDAEAKMIVFHFEKE